MAAPASFNRHYRAYPAFALRIKVRPTSPPIIKHPRKWSQNWRLSLKYTTRKPMSHSPQHSLESAEDRATAARRKNAQAQKEYRVRKKEYELALEAKNAMLDSQVQLLQQRLQEAETYAKQIETQLLQIRLAQYEGQIYDSTVEVSPATLYKPSAPVTIPYNHHYQHAAELIGSPISNPSHSQDSSYMMQDASTSVFLDNMRVPAQRYPVQQFSVTI